MYLLAAHVKDLGSLKGQLELYPFRRKEEQTHLTSLSLSLDSSFHVTVGSEVRALTFLWLGLVLPDTGRGGVQLPDVDCARGGWPERLTDLPVGRSGVSAGET